MRAGCLVEPGRHAVGILGRIEPARRVGHVAQHVGERVLGDVEEERLACRLPRLEIRQRQLGLVVEHLLEMRHAPLGVDRVAVKPAADVIAHAAERHRPQRLGRHQQRRLRAAAAGRAPGVLAQQQQQLRGTRKLRRLAEAAVPGVERQLELFDGDVERLRVRDRALLARASPRAGDELQPIEQLAGGMLDAGAVLLPHTRELAEQIEEARLAPPRRRRKVGAAVERLQVRRQEHRHRPAAGSGRRLHERHVDAIDVGPLLAIDLDRDEVAVQPPRDLLVHERLVLHDVAPVAGGVADREEDRLVLRARAREGLVAPGIPVDGIGGVLQQVGAALARQSVHFAASRTGQDATSRRSSRGREPSGDAGCSRTDVLPRSTSSRNRGGTGLPGDQQSSHATDRTISAAGTSLTLQSPHEHRRQARRDPRRGRLRGQRAHRTIGRTAGRGRDRDARRAVCGAAIHRQTRPRRHLGRRGGRGASGDFDALVIPGGYAADRMRMRHAMVDLTRDMAAAGKPVAAICHGPQLLISADVLRGRTVTCWPSIAIDVTQRRRALRRSAGRQGRQPDHLAQAGRRAAVHGGGDRRAGGVSDGMELAVETHGLTRDFGSSAPSTASTSRCPRAASTASSDRTAPASRPPSSASPAC